MAKNTKRRRSKKRRPDFFKKYKTPLFLMAGAGLILCVLIYTARITEQPSAPELPPVAKPVVDYDRVVRDEVESFLSEFQIDSKDIQREASQAETRYTILGSSPAKEALARLSKRLNTLPGAYSLLVQDRNTLLVDKSGETKITIVFVPKAPEVPAGPLMTIIMDDLGRSRHVADVLTSLAEPVTFSILPGETHAARVAEIAHEAGHEVMLHVPMEPQGYPAVNPGSDALFVKYRTEEIRARFDKLLTQVPYLSGANNHMGSRFTEDARALAPVMQMMQQKKLFFVDSRTTGQSKVMEVADRYGVPTLSRDVFLDNVADVDAIVREIKRLESRARRAGQAIGICHPYPETLEALRRELPKMKERGISVVPVSVQFQRKLLTQGS